MKPQTIFRRTRRDQPFTMLSKAITSDRRISFECKGFLITILDLPPDWTFNIAWLRKEFGIGRDKAYSLIREAGERGYCRRIDHRGPHGGTVKIEYLFADDPAAFPQDDCPSTTTARNLLPENPEAGSENRLPENPESGFSGDILSTISKNKGHLGEKGSAPACTQDEKPKPEPEIRLTGGKVVLSDSARTFWLEQFGGDAVRLDLALIEAGCNVQSNSRAAVELQITRQLARIAGDKRDRDARYAAAAPKGSRRGPASGGKADRKGTVEPGPLANYIAARERGEKYTGPVSTVEPGPFAKLVEAKLAAERAARGEIAQ